MKKIFHSHGGRSFFKLQLVPVVSTLAMILIIGFQSPADAQGNLTPPGAPAPMMKSLDQIEPRTPISSAPITITQPGSYYLTTNLTVTSGNAITINTNQVTLNLNGFTISSTASPASGNGIALAGGNTGVAICNGFIAGAVTNNAGTFSGAGFSNGIFYLASLPANVRVSGISVSGCLSNGIYLGLGNSTVVESCTIKTIGNFGIYADSVSRSTVQECGNIGFNSGTTSDCRGQTIGNGYGFSVATAHNCLGQNNGNGTGLSATIADNCEGSNNGNGYGLLAETANNCVGTGGGTGLACNIANGCYGGGNTGAGISAVNANNCEGISASGAGILVTGTAMGCYGSSVSGAGINAHIANSCTVASGTTNITFKYNMP